MTEFCFFSPMERETEAENENKKNSASNTSYKKDEV